MAATCRSPAVRRVCVVAARHRPAAGRLAVPEAASRVASGIREAVRRGADVLQLSLAFDPEQGRACADIKLALAAAASRGIVAVIAAGNSAHRAPSPILQAPEVVGVMAADARGAPLSIGVLGPGVGQRGLRAPGESIPGAIPNSSIGWTAGSSVAACFVTATFALLRCQFSTHDAREILAALLRPHGIGAGCTVIPPRLDGDASAARLRQSPRSHFRISHDNAH
jgi:subtilisin family serine protease